MVDLPLMFKLVQALPANARLILCGDKDQLASVETGSVLADMCGEANKNRYSKKFAGQIEALTQGRLDKVGYTVCDDPAPLEDCRVLLRQTYRFPAHSDIHRVSQGVNAGDGPKTLQLLRQSNGTTVSWRANTSPQAIYTALAKIIIERYRKLFSTATPQLAVDQLNRFKVLCAVQRGPWGALTINQQIENHLIKAGLINPIGGNPWYPGRPVLITRNHHARGLYNGDMGLTLPVRDDRPMELRVYFPGDDEKMRVMMPSVLPEHETAYAITVHKSQGSEFQDVALVLPENDSPVLTKELLYTGMTRTRRRITIWSSEETLVRTIARRTDRSSGLREKLRKRPA
jgi:exodeoxyribonuclease V alpha subunit